MNSLEEVFIAMVEEGKNQDPNYKIPDNVKSYCHYINLDRLAELRSRLERVKKMKYVCGSGQSISSRNFNARKSSLIGKIFESMIAAIFDESEMFTVQKNQRSGTSEFDLLITVNQPYKAHFDIFNTINHMVSECKCYTTPPKNAWVAKLVGVMNIHSTTFGLIFVYWQKKKAATEFNQMIWQQYHRGQQPFVVLPFGISQLDEIQSGKSFINIIQSQKTALETQVPFKL